LTQKLLNKNIDMSSFRWRGIVEILEVASKVVYRED
jgi:hypothetical protein